ncbi:hypothetical protein [Nocardia sp. NPDC051981]|uniref:hypothetical protein n=1 Tax=Nocardia sp. NPDC051981 TaxID=3155417 RepID=UPI003443D477
MVAVRRRVARAAVRGTISAIGSMSGVRRATDSERSTARLISLEADLPALLEEKKL